MRLLANAEIYSVASSLDTLNGSVTVSAPLSAMTMSLRGLSRESVLVCSILRTISCNRILKL